MKIIVVSAATISTTNITGFLIMHARIELDERLPDRRHEDRGVQHRGLRRAHLVANFHGLAACVKEGAGVHREVLDDGAE